MSTWVADILTTLLERLRAEWERLNAPVAGALRPGLGESELAVVEERLQLRLPTELKILWSWHDGCDAGVDRRIGPGSYEFLSSADAVAEYHFNLSVHPEEPDSDGLFWRRTWVPFMKQDTQRLYIDTERHTLAGASPVRLVTWEWEDFDVDRAPSLAAAVSMWTWLLSADYYRWTGRGWDESRPHSDIPLFARWTLA